MTNYHLQYLFLSFFSLFFLNYIKHRYIKSVAHEVGFFVVLIHHPLKKVSLFTCSTLHHCHHLTTTSTTFYHTTKWDSKVQLLIFFFTVLDNPKTLILLVPYKYFDLLTFFFRSFQVSYYPLQWLCLHLRFRLT